MPLVKGFCKVAMGLMLRLNVTIRRPVLWAQGVRGVVKGLTEGVKSRGIHLALGHKALVSQL